MAKEKKEQAPESVSKGSAVVFDGGGNFVRAYTPGEHGPKFGDLAKLFVSKKGREKYTVLEK